MSQSGGELKTQVEEEAARLRSAEERLVRFDNALGDKPIRVELQNSNPPGGQYSATSGLIKDEIILLSSFVLFVGIISTETHYATFGVRYQFLGLPTFHVVYRGLSIVSAAPYLLLPYLLAVVWLGVERYVPAEKRPRWLRLHRFVSFLVISLLLLITYPLARLAGRATGEADLYADTTTLPRIVNLQVREDTYGPEDGYCLLLVDADYVIIFKPLAQGDASAVPIIKRFSKGDVHVIETGR